MGARNACCVVKALHYLLIHTLFLSPEKRTKQEINLFLKEKYFAPLHEENKLYLHTVKQIRLLVQVYLYYVS